MSCSPPQWMPRMVDLENEDFSVDVEPPTKEFAFDACKLPTSRASVTLASADPEADPVIDPRYYSTEADRCMLRSALRRMMQVMETTEMQSVIEGEAPPPGLPRLSSQSVDEEIDARVRAASAVIHHTAGTAAMGKVVDSKLHVQGVGGLRVVDASIFPLPVVGYTQLTVYAVAESAADLIIKEAKKQQ